MQNKEYPNLRECPFCGGKPHFEKYASTTHFGVEVEFTHTCGGRDPGNNKRISVYGRGFDSEEEATEEWNRGVCNEWLC